MPHGTPPRQLEPGRSNRFLAILPPHDFAMLTPHLRTVTLEHGVMLHDVAEEIERVYFPHAANACSHNTSGLRSPALASSMILMAMACLTLSSQSPVRKAMQVISRATPRTRLVSRSNRSPLRKG
jgi:hypothetical protein